MSRMKSLSDMVKIGMVIAGIVISMVLLDYITRLFLCFVIPMHVPFVYTEYMFKWSIFAFVFMIVMFTFDFNAIEDSDTRDWVYLETIFFSLLTGNLISFGIWRINRIRDAAHWLLSESYMMLLIMEMMHLAIFMSLYLLLVGFGWICLFKKLQPYIKNK
jgi:hypothetical protein